MTMRTYCSDIWWTTSKVQSDRSVLCTIRDAEARCVKPVEGTREHLVAVIQPRDAETAFVYAIAYISCPNWRQNVFKRTSDYTQAQSQPEKVII